MKIIFYKRSTPRGSASCVKLYRLDYEPAALEPIYWKFGAMPTSYPWFR